MLARMRPFLGVLMAMAAVIGVYVGQDSLENDPPGIPDGFTYVVDSYGGLTYEEAVEMREQGVTVYVQALSALPPQGLVHPPDRVNSLRNAHLAGLGTAGYALVGCAGGPNGANDMQFARFGLPTDVWERLIFVAVDVEIPCQTLDDMDRALDTVEAWGKGRIVYTSYSWWALEKGNPTRTDGTLLWNAWWDDDPDLDFVRRPYGGFKPEEVIGEQFQGGSHPAGCSIMCDLTLVAGHNVDLNIFRFVPSTSEPVPQPVEQPIWSQAEPNWRWVFPNGTSYDPATRIWHNPDGEPEWGPCLSWNGRLNLRLNVRTHGGQGFYDDAKGYWTTAPLCH